MLKTKRPDPACLGCGEVLDDFTALTRGALPRRGDVSVCLRCSALAVYSGNGLDLEPVPAGQLERIRNSPEVQLALAVCREVRRTRGSWPGLKRRDKE